MAHQALVHLPDIPANPLAELTAWCSHKRRSLASMRGMIRKSMAEFEEKPEIPKCMSTGAAETYSTLQAYLSRVAKAGFIRRNADVATATSMLISVVFHDAIARDLMPKAFPQPASEAAGKYACACLASLGYLATPANRSPARRPRAS